MPSEDTFKLKEQLCIPALQRINVGMVKKQVGVAFTYPHIHSSGMVIGLLRPLLFRKARVYCKQ